MQDNDLDRLLARAAAAPPTLSPGLLDRVLIDALAEQDRLGGLAHSGTRTTRRQRTGPAALLHRLAGVFGGPPIMAGLVTAALAGVAIGYLEPEMLDLLTGGDAEIVDLFPEVDFLTTEG